MRGNGILKLFIGLAIAVFLGHQLYSSAYKPITTQSAEFHEAVDGLNVTGIIMRSEHLVTNGASGVLHFVVEDGSRVAKGGVIADIYDSASASRTVSRIGEVTKQINDITEIVSYNDLQAVDIELINSRVLSSLGNLVYSNSFGSFSSAAEDETALLSAINRRQIVTGEQNDFSGRLEQLNAELASLNASLPAATGSVRAALSGYFVSGTDGYENLIDCSKLDGITPEFLSELKPEQVEDNVIGKIVSDYEWYIAANVSLNDSLKYKQGDRVELHTGIKSNPTLDVTVKQINISESSDKAAVIFSCSQMSSELAEMRMGNMTVVSHNYSGLKLSKKALRVVDGKTGVYIVSGITVKFVPVTVIYSNDEFMICKQEQSEGNVLRLYDEVVVKGKKLYDGKIIG